MIWRRISSIFLRPVGAIAVIERSHSEMDEDLNDIEKKNQTRRPLGRNTGAVTQLKEESG